MDIIHVMSNYGKGQGVIITKTFRKNPLYDKEQSKILKHVRILNVEGCWMVPRFSVDNILIIVAQFYKNSKQ
jgi:hypothetical protein